MVIVYFGINCVIDDFIIGVLVVFIDCFKGLVVWVFKDINEEFLFFQNINLRFFFVLLFYVVDKFEIEFIFFFVSKFDFGRDFIWGQF